MTDLATDTQPPPMWPGMDPTMDSRLATAWRAMWAETPTGEWVRLGHLAYIARHATTPRLMDRTIRSMLKTLTAHEAFEVRMAADGKHREVRRAAR